MECFQFNLHIYTSFLFVFSLCLLHRFVSSFSFFFFVFSMPNLLFLFIDIYNSIRLCPTDLIREITIGGLPGALNRSHGRESHTHTHMHKHTHTLNRRRRTISHTDNDNTLRLTKKNKRTSLPHIHILRTYRHSLGTNGDTLEILINKGILKIIINRRTIIMALAVKKKGSSFFYMLEFI